MRVVAAKIEREFVVGIDLVRVAAAGGIVPIEVHPVDHAIEGLHKAQRGIGNARTNDDGKDEQQQQISAGLIRRFLLAVEQFF